MIADIFTTFEEHVLPELAPTETEPQTAELFKVEETAPQEPTTPEHNAPIDEEALAGRVVSMVLEALKRQEGADDGR